MTQSPQKNTDRKIRSSHGQNDTHITLYLPPTSRKHVERNCIKCEDPRFYEEIDEHGMDENFLDTKIGEFLEKQIKPFIIKKGWQYMGYHAGAFYAFDCIGPYKCCMKHIKKKPFWKDMPDIKITKIVICDKVGRDSDDPIYGGRDYVLIGNAQDHRHDLPPSTVVTIDTHRDGAPSEFNIEYDKDGEAIFNKTNFIDFFAEQMKKFVDEQVEKRVGDIEQATTVFPPSRVESIENLPIAEAILLNENEAIV